MQKIKEIIIQSIPVDTELVDRIVAKRNIERSKVVKMLSYNVITVNQLRILTGGSSGKVESRIRPRQVKGEVMIEFTLTFPFPEKNNGWRFIYRDENVEKFLRENNS